MEPLKVCFISLKCFPLFNPGSLDYFGGAEVQISLIAKELAKDNHFQVSLITGDYGQPPVVKKDGLTIYKTKVWDFLAILKKVNADIFIERTINPKIPVVWLWCKKFRKKFVYMVAHNWDLQHRVIKLADLIIAQSRLQQSKLKGILMPPVIKINPSQKKIKRQFILWVGRDDDWKRPLDFIKLARKLPQEQFTMICRPGNLRFSPPPLSNLKFIPTVPANKIMAYFRRAKLLVNTSVAEGWPNTFLQAGATKTPVITDNVNPDSYLNKYGCGVIGYNQLKQLLNQPVRLKKMGLNHYEYVKKNHGLKNVAVLKKALKALS